MCDALHYLLDNIFIRFGSKLYRQIVGIPMGTNCTPLVADLFLVCYETSCCLCQTIIKLILLKLLTPPPDVKFSGIYRTYHLFKIRIINIK